LPHLKTQQRSTCVPLSDMPLNSPLPSEFSIGYDTTSRKQGGELGAREYFRRLTCRVFAAHDELQVPIGTLHASIAHIAGAVYAGDDPEVVFDGNDQDTFDLTRPLLDPEDASTLSKAVSQRCPQSMHSNILLLNSFYLEPAYRGLGISLTVIADVIEDYCPFGGVAVLKAYPLTPDGEETPARNRIGKKLARHWGALGFIGLPSSKLMVLDPGMQGPVAYRSALARWDYALPKKRMALAVALAAKAELAERMSED